MTTYQASDLEFSSLVEAIKDGELQTARRMLDDMIEGYALDAREDAIEELGGDEEEAPDLTRAKEELRGGRRVEGVIFLERWLGHDFLDTLPRGR